MTPDPEDWASLVSRLRSVLIGLLRQSPEIGTAVADALDLVEELDELHQKQISAAGPPGALRKRRRQNAYRVVKRESGWVLEERFAEGRQPFRCPEGVYQAVAEVFSGLKEPTSFDDLLRRVRKALGKDDVPDYQPRLCIRLWTFSEPPLIDKVGTRYQPRPGVNLRTEARRLWRDLA
jgi:hypothetical protein